MPFGGRGYGTLGDLAMMEPGPRRRGNRFNAMGGGMGGGQLNAGFGPMGGGMGGGMRRQPWQELDPTRNTGFGGGMQRGPIQGPPPGGALPFPGGQLPPGPFNAPPEQMMEPPLEDASRRYRRMLAQRYGG